MKRGLAWVGVILSAVALDLGARFAFGQRTRRRTGPEIASSDSLEETARES